MVFKKLIEQEGLKMSAKEKENKLIEIAKLKESVISENISLSDLFRLVDGDLSHIGDGILKGKGVIYEGERSFSLSFSDYAKAYTLAPVTEKVCGVEIEPFVEKTLKRLEFLGGVDCWKVEWGTVSGAYVAKRDIMFEFSNSVNKRIFKNQSDAEAVAEAMNRFMEEGC